MVVSNLPVPDIITSEPDSNNLISNKEPDILVLLGVGVIVFVGVTDGVTLFVGVVVGLSVGVFVGVVIIFDECHRSQFGDMHQAITKAFKKYYLYGFTGTPIFAINASSSNKPNLKTTEQAFGNKLHTILS